MLMYYLNMAQSAQDGLREVGMADSRNLGPVARSPFGARDELHMTPAQEC